MTEVVKVMKIDYSEKVIYTIVREAKPARVPQGRRDTVPERSSIAVRIRESLPKTPAFALPLAA